MVYQSKVVMINEMLEPLKIKSPRKKRNLIIVFSACLVFILFYVCTYEGEYFVQTTYMEYSPTSPTYGDIKFKIDSSNSDAHSIFNNESTKDATLEWIETLNYTVDYGDTSCKENKYGNPLKEINVDLFKQWKSISKKHNISYFLVYGSLIGAVRNENFIPYDGDVDIMVNEADYEVLASIDNKRNFIERPNDVNIHLVVQNFFREQYSNMHKPRQNCLGKVDFNLFTILYIL